MTVWIIQSNWTVRDFFLDLPKLDSEDMQHVIWRNIFKVGCLDQGIEMITHDFFLKAFQYTP